MREFHKEQIKALKIIYSFIVKDVDMRLTLSRVGYPDLFIAKRESSFSIIYSDDKRLRNFYYLIYTLILLKNDGDILFLDNGVLPINQSEKANEVINEKFKKCIIKDEYIIEFLNTNWNKTILFSNTLIDYIIYGKTSEQRRHRKTQKTAWVGILLALLIGFVGLFKNNFKEPGNNQLNQIKQPIQIEKKAIVSDTLKVENNGI